MTEEKKEPTVMEAATELQEYLNKNDMAHVNLQVTFENIKLEGWPKGRSITLIVHEANTKFTEAPDEEDSDEDEDDL